MARENAVKGLRKKLIERRDEMLRIVHGTKSDMTAYSDTGDDADAAVVSIKNEMLAKLAEMEERELVQINHALVRMGQGNYGACEACGSNIPIARLEMLPYATFCVNCQREVELNPERRDELEAGWSRSLNPTNGPLAPSDSNGAKVPAKVEAAQAPATTLVTKVSPKAATKEPAVASSAKANKAPAKANKAPAKVGKTPAKAGKTTAKAAKTPARGTRSVRSARSARPPAKKSSARR